MTATPGPWEIVWSVNTQRPMEIIGPNRRRIILWCGIAARADPESHANAKLIAAAPALADEGARLVAFLAHVVEYAHYGSDDDTDKEVLRRIESEAHGLAKALGYDGNQTNALRLAGRLP